MSGKSTKSRFLLVLITEILVQIHCTYSSSCDKTMIRYGVSERDKQGILENHNKMRQLVALGQVGNQPPASNMAKMTWSDELARRALQWAMSCAPYVHDPGRHMGSFLIGQNIATKWTTRVPSSYQDAEPDWYTDAFGPWFSEYTLYTYNRLTSTNTGHYTQLIWADTTAVGCGYAYYKEYNKYTKKYVCNYGPSGNVEGEAPYQMGYPNCYNHGMVSSRSYPGLCEAGTSGKPTLTNNKLNYNDFHLYDFLNVLG